MEALDNPSYFSVTDEREVSAGGPRARDVAPEFWRVRRSSETVLLSGQDTAYYNVNRRHSLSTFPRTVRPKQVVVDKSGKMLDITLVSSSESEDATLWANYLISCFHEISREENKPPFKLARVMIENVLMGLPVEGSSGSRLQIVIVCPKFLRVLSNSQGVPILATLLQPATVLAMLLGVTPQLLENHQYAGLFRFEQWRKMTVKDKDKTFVGDFLGVAMDVLSRSWQLQQAMQQVKLDSSRSHFSIVPKKIKVGQNKLLILLNDPLCNSDKINIFVERTGQKIEVTSIKRRNPYTLQFSMPSVCLQTSQLVAVNVERNGRSIGHRLVKCECRLRELDQLLRSTDNPLAFMCQALGINGGDRDQLDSFFVAALQKNIPPNFNLLNAAATSTSTSKEEFPTLLHFAARFGLEKLCWQLLECPGGEGASQIKNANQLSPADLAEKHGHTSLAHSLNSYLQMTELSSMYTYMNAYLKSTAEKPQDFGEGNYLLPRPLSDTYLVPPKARPVTPSLEPSLPDYRVPPSPVSTPTSPPPNMMVPPLTLDPMENYQSPPQARPFTPSTPSTPTDHFSAYLQMHSPMSDTSSTNFENILSPEKKYSSHPSSDNVSIASSGHHYMNTRCGSSTCGSSVSSKISPDEELAEIINDFKNNVYTISELEKLVEAWKNRNDVQQSFREKKEQINQMRQEYERIQLKMKEQLKRPTPFDRIKKFFSRKSKHEGGHHKDKVSGQEGSVVCQRPVSSLSLHSSCSSSSSGRMSTTSGVSLGDSGTHSDPEEKKSEVSMEKTVSPSPAFYERIHRQESLPDEYVQASGYTSKCSLPQPPSSLKRTVVDVHRSDVLEEMQEENSDQTVKTVEELVEQFENLQGPENSDNNYVTPNSSEVIYEMSDIDNKCHLEMKILEQSEKLLKDMADGLSCKENDDILSPPESAFINDDTVAENEEDAQNADLELDSDVATTKEASTKDDDMYVLNSYVDSMSLSTQLSQSIIEAAPTKDPVVLKEQIQSEHEDSIFSDNLHEYVNVTSYLPPPIPPRCKYKNVIL